MISLFVSVAVAAVAVATTVHVMRTRRRTCNPLKFGFDIHGVIDALPEVFAEMTRTLVDSGHEVHILTGSMWKKEIEDELRGYGIKWTHHFSIADYRIKHCPEIVTFDEKGNPWMPADLWDSAKAEYCREHGISLHLDDTKRYNDFFTTPFARVWTHNNKPKGEHRDERHKD